MEGSFSVSTNNRFAFFMDEEDDPGDIVVEESSKNDKSRPSKETATTTGNGTAKDSSPKTQKGTPKEKGDSNKKSDVTKKRDTNSSTTAANNGPRENKTGGNNSTGDKPQRGFRDNKRNGNSSNDRNDRGGHENYPPRQQGFRNRGRLPSKDAPDGAPEDSNNGGDSRSRPRWNRDRQGERGERGDRVGGGGEGGGERRFNPFRNRGGGAFRGGKREFERRSGSDKSSVKAFDKREGGGAHNWGTVKDEMNSNDWPNDETETPAVQGEDNTTGPDSTNDTEDTNAISSEVKDEQTTEGKEGEGEGGEEEKEEEQLTLDEYKALQEKKRSVPLFKERRPGENEDQTRWKNTFVYERTEGELVPGSREIVEKLKTSGREKTVVECNFFFRDPQRFGGERGGRGGGRGGGPGPKRGFGDRRNDDERRGDGRRGDDERRGDGRRGDDERRGDGRRSFGDRRNDEERRGGDERRNNDRGERRNEDRRRGGGGDRRPPRNRDRSNFNVEDEKDFPSLGTVSA